MFVDPFKGLLAKLDPQKAMEISLMQKQLAAEMIATRRADLAEWEATGVKPDIPANAIYGIPED